MYCGRKTTFYTYIYIQTEFTNVGKRYVLIITPREYKRNKRKIIIIIKNKIKIVSPCTRA